MKRIVFNLLLITFGLFVISSCTKVIQVTVPNGSTLIVVDAFIDNTPQQAQTVHLSFTSNYFSNTVSPPPVLGATVTLKDLTNALTYAFTSDGKGGYVYTPVVKDSMATVGHKYQLNILYNGNTYTALSTLHPTTPVDSIDFRASRNDPEGKYPNDTSSPRIYYPIYAAIDIKGEEDYYWVKVSKNGVFYNGANQLNAFQDAGFPGTDGEPFLPPVCYFGLTPSSNPLYKGDVCTVEILSINENTSEFLAQLQGQLTNSQNGLFALTPQNVKTNIQLVSGTQQAIGWFNMGATTSRSRVAQ
jgi:hypothetical protein